MINHDNAELLCWSWHCKLIAVLYLFYSENKHLSVGTEDGEIYIWNVTQMAFERKFKIHKSSVMAVSYGPDGLTLASCGKDRLIQIMDVNTGMSVFSKLLNSSILCLKWVDFLLLLGCEDGSFVLWDVEHVVPLLDVAAHSGNLILWWLFAIFSSIMFICRANKVHWTFTEQRLYCYW